MTQHLRSIMKVCLPALAGALLVSPGLLGQEMTGNQNQDYAGHYRVFTGSGEPATLDDIIAAAREAEAVLIGEIHTDPVGHWVQAELFQRIVKGYRQREIIRVYRGGGQVYSETQGYYPEPSLPEHPLALSLEMFERDVQYILDEYLQDIITESQFKASARPWEHYDEDYRPMVEAAKAAGIPVLAANAPRRYVNRVSRLGRDALEDLSPTARSFLPPLPFPEPTDAYREDWTTLMSNMTMESQCPVPEPEAEEDAPAHGMPTAHVAPPAHADTIADEPEAKGPPAGMPSHMGSFMENGLQAQTLWDASMAHAITTFLDANPGSLVVHMVGGFHVKNFTGTPEKIEFYRPGTRQLVVHMDLAEDFTTFDPEEHAGRGDFVILTDQSLDLNYQRNCLDTEGGSR